MSSVDIGRLVQAVRAFGDRRVLVLGDVMLDVYDFCSTSNSKPIDSEMEGKRAFTAHESIRVLGGAGNVAANLSALGVHTTLIGVTGDDGHHFTLQKIAEKQGVDHCLIRDHGRPTTVKTRIYVDDEFLLRRDDEVRDEVSRELELTIMTEFLKDVDNADAVILSDYDKGFFTQTLGQQLVSGCRDHKTPVVVDFKPPNAAYFRGATLIAPNEGEADTLQPGFRGARDRLAAVQALHNTLGCDATAVTLGDDGLCGTDGTTPFHVRGHRVQEVDAVGCGDTVRAVIALGIASGLTLQDSVWLANCAAAAIIQKRATATLEPDEIIAFMNSTQQ